MIQRKLSWGQRFSALFRGHVQPAAGRQIRSFNAGAISRLTQDLTRSNVSIDTDLVRQLRIMRARSRNLFKNEVYTRRFVSLVTKNVVGPEGIALKMRVRDTAGTPDRVANEIITRNWQRWGRRDLASVNARHTWRQLQKLALKTVVVDGECLIRKIRTGKAPYGFALQILDTDVLNEDHNEELRNGNRIRMGVEIDPGGRPIAYHITTRSPVDYLRSTELRFTTERVPADQICHLYVDDFTNQTRGIPWLFAAIMRLNMLGGYEEAELVASRVASAKMGFLIPGDDTEYDGDGEGADGSTLNDVEPGSWEELPPGYKVQSWDPQHPNASFDAFIKAMLRGIAAAGSVSYHSISQDLSSANYSSLRTGLLDERETWIDHQNWMIESFHEPVFSDWLESALLMDALRPLPLARIEKFDAPLFVGRRWAWVDPAKEQSANAIAIRERLKSRSRIITEMGGDPDDTWQEIADENEKLDALGITLADDPMTPEGAAAAASADSES